MTFKDTARTYLQESVFFALEEQCSEEDIYTWIEETFQEWKNGQEPEELNLGPTDTPDPEEQQFAESGYPDDDTDVEPDTEEEDDTDPPTVTDEDQEDD